MLNLMIPLIRAYAAKEHDENHIFNKIKSDFFKNCSIVISGYYNTLVSGKVIVSYGPDHLNISLPEIDEHIVQKKDESGASEVFEQVCIYVRYQIMKDIISAHPTGVKLGGHDLMDDYERGFKKGFATKKSLYYHPEMVFGAIVNELLAQNNLAHTEFETVLSEQEGVLQSREISDALKQYRFTYSRDYDGDTLTFNITKDVDGAKLIDNLFEEEQKC